MNGRPWTDDELETVRINYADWPTFLVAYLVDRTEASVYQVAGQLGLRKSKKYMASKWACRLRGDDEPGKQHRFKKGQVPANKGLRRPGWAPGRMAETQFKKGRPAHEARNYRPIGSHRIVYGNLERKVTDDPSLYPAKRWRPVHRLIWEATHGPVPCGQIVVFKPGKHTTVESEITLDRIECITFAENMKRNTIHNYPPAVKDTMRLVGRINREIRKQQREKQNRGSKGSPVRHARGSARSAKADGARSSASDRRCREGHRGQRQG